MAFLVVGNIGLYIMVGWKDGAVCMRNSIKRYHGFTQLNADEVDTMIDLLKKSKAEMLAAKESEDEIQPKG